MDRPGRLVLLGHPLGHSLSPRFHNAALEAAGIPLRYEALDVPPVDLPRVLQSLRAEHAAGNVTIPHKERVRHACEVVTPLAARVGAVNTFWTEDGTLYGDNTDVGGFDAAVGRLLGTRPSSVTVGLLGAGGAAAAVVAAVERWPDSRVLVFNRTAERADALCARFGSVAQRIGDREELASAHIVVNATSVGLHDDAFPIELEVLRKDAALVDLVYRAGETAWVRAARARGHQALDGLPMLIEQGALAFERWFGRAPDREVMWRTVQPS